MNHLIVILFVFAVPYIFHRVSNEQKKKAENRIRAINEYNYIIQTIEMAKDINTIVWMDIRIEHFDNYYGFFLPSKEHNEKVKEMTRRCSRKENLLLPKERRQYYASN